MAKGKKLPSNYFKLVNPLVAILTLAGVAFLVVTFVDHKHICPEIFGPVSEYATVLATQYKYYLKIGLLVVAAIHLLETLVAVYKCYKLRLNTVVTLAWTVQTLLLGILSLVLLIWPQKPSPQPQQQQQKGKQQGGKQKDKGGAKQNNKQGKNQQQPAKASKSKKEK